MPNGEMKDNQFPECFPSDFADNLLPKDVDYLEVREVYRVAKFPGKTKDNFLSNQEEYERGLKPSKAKKPWKAQKKKAGAYGTSFHTDPEALRYFLDTIIQDHPDGRILKGDLLPEYGPRKFDNPKEKTGHLNCWIYRDADPSETFNDYCEDLEE